VSAGAEELGLLRDSVRDALRDLSPPEEVRRQMETERGWDPKSWQRLCGELGIAGLAVPEEYGGGGFSYVELGIVFEEAGRVLLCAPLLSTAGLAVPLLLALDDEDARRDYLPGLCDGSMAATAVVSDAAGRSWPDVTPIEAVTQNGEWRLSGAAGFVIDGAHADLFLVPARTAEGLAVFAVETGSAGPAVTPLVTLDPTRRQTALDFDAVPARRLAATDAAASLAQALDVARAMLACEQAGGAVRCLETVVEYTKTRVQFGRPIGSFQAVKQRAAEMLIKVESARSAAMAAAQSAAEAAAQPIAAPEGLRDLPAPAVTAAIAKSYCSEAYVFASGETIQLHGGIGFTWEHDAHLYYKRAWTSREMFGRPEDHVESLARHLGET
jgi:acyl-CoA dehydrogenase